MSFFKQNLCQIGRVGDLSKGLRLIRGLSGLSGDLVFSAQCGPEGGVWESWSCHRCVSRDTQVEEF